MRVLPVDWLIVLIAVGLSFLPAVVMARRAGRSTAEFFTSGRSAPWWLIGISMVATTFSTDTPNLVTNLVREKGVANNWQWWAFLLTGMATVFFYARLWRRSRVLTDLEFYEIRYAGSAATFVRGFRAIYLGLFFNCVIMASVNLAAAKIANVMLGWPMGKTLLICAVHQRGLRRHVGALGRPGDRLHPVRHRDDRFVLRRRTSRSSSPKSAGWRDWCPETDPGTLRLLPDFGDWGLDRLGAHHPAHRAVVVGLVSRRRAGGRELHRPADAGGAERARRDGGHPALQRRPLRPALLALDPRGALRRCWCIPTCPTSRAPSPTWTRSSSATTWPIPPCSGSSRAGFMGLMMAGMLAAYVSTISTHLNWGTSYLVHDLYRRFSGPGASEKHYVRSGGSSPVLLMLAAAGLTSSSIRPGRAFDLLLSIGAGTGLLYLLRWFWWRINAWSEIAAMISSFVVSIGFFVARKGGHGGRPLGLPGHHRSGHHRRVGDCHTADPAHRIGALVRFYRLVRPAGPGWKRIAAKAGPLDAPPDTLTRSLLGWVLGCCLRLRRAVRRGELYLREYRARRVMGRALHAQRPGLLRLLPKLWAGATEKPA